MLGFREGQVWSFDCWGLAGVAMCVACFRLLVRVSGMGFRSLRFCVHSASFVVFFDICP